MGEVFLDTGADTIELELGDRSIPFGLWKAIQEMRRGEKSLIMLKPKYGYDHEQLKDFVNFPLDWKSSQERRT